MLGHEHRHGLWMMMRSDLGGVEDARDDAFDRFEILAASITGSLKSGKRCPWEELCMMRAPKFSSDVIESILGAIFVDRNTNSAACRTFWSL